jgi:hypothetical protein
VLVRQFLVCPHHLGAAEHSHHPSVLLRIHHRNLVDVPFGEALERLAEGLPGPCGHQALGHHVPYGPVTQLSLEDGPLQVRDGDDPRRTFPGVQHHPAAIRPLPGHLRQFGQGQLRRHGRYLLAHGVVHQDEIQRPWLPGPVGSTPPAELDGVDGVRVDAGRHQLRQDHRQHQRKDDAVVVRHLEEDDGGGEGRVGGGAEDGGGPHQCVGTGRARQGREQPVGGLSKRPARHGTNEEGRRKDPAGPSGAQGDRGGRDLHEDQGRHEGDGELPGHGQLHPFVPHPKEVRAPEGAQEPHQQAPRQRLAPDRRAPAVEPGFHAIDRPDVQEGDEPGGEPQERIERQLPVGDQPELLHQSEGRLGPQDGLSRRRGGHRRHHHQPEGASGEAAQDDLEGEQHAGDGGVEGRSDGPRGSCSHQDPHLLRAHPHELGHRAPQGGPDLDDGPLPAH